MKCLIPEIAWHNRDPVLSVDFQPIQNDALIRLATGGCDSHVVIWYVKTDNSGSINIEVAADLFHHQKAVNVVRWSPSGEYLASGDDESAIIIWRQKTDIEPPPLFDQNSEQDRETWIVYKILRGHVEDVYDLSWCPMSKFVISGSVDNTAIVWDIHKGKSLGMLHHKGFVQGVMWDPNNQYLATMSSDRVFRVFDVNTKKAISRSSKGILPVPVLHPLKGQTVRLYHDDTLQSFFRRLHMSPDGELIAVPTGFIEGDPAKGIKNMNTAYIYSRYNLQLPICVLPCGDSPALAVRWSPVKYQPRKDGPSPLINLPTVARMILAVGTNDSITIYDTQQSTPLAVVLNPQYARLTDMTWSCDGNVLIVSSSDGYCSIITFVENELGDVCCEEIKNDLPTTEAEKKQDEPMDIDPPNEVKLDKVETMKIEAKKTDIVNSIEEKTQIAKTSETVNKIEVNRITPTTIQPVNKTEVKRITPTMIQPANKIEVKRITPKTIQPVNKAEVKRITPSMIQPANKIEVKRITLKTIQPVNKIEVKRITPITLGPTNQVEEKKETPKKEGVANKTEVKKITPKSKEKKKQTPKTNKCKGEQKSIFEMLTPKTKSPKPKSLFGVKEKAQEENKNSGLIDEAAMEPWSQDGFATKLKNTSPVKNPDESIIIIDDPTQDMHLVYEETQDSEKSCMKGEKQEQKEKEHTKLEVESIPSTSRLASPVVTQKVKQAAENNSPASSLPKTPRRVSFITLSSPKNKKKPPV